MNHRKWKNVGLNLIFSARARSIQQEIEDRRHQEIEELRQEVKELREQLKEQENTRIKQQLHYEEQEDRLTL